MNLRGKVAFTIGHPLAAMKYAVRHMARYLLWPGPLSALRGYATLIVAAQHLKFDAGSQWRWLRRLRAGTWERGMLEFLVEHLHPGDTFVDIGAWNGLYSVLASRLVGQTGKVYAFEPDPVARRLLCKNVELNGATNVVVLPQAVSDSRQRVYLASGAFGDSLTHIVDNPQDNREGDFVGVEAIDLDTFVREQGIELSAAKIDVEGAEERLLAGGRHALSQARFILLEFHPSQIRSLGGDPDVFLVNLRAMGKSICVAENYVDGRIGSEVPSDAPIPNRAHLVLVEPTVRA